MNPTIVASIIAGIVTLISVVGTLIVARWGFQATMKAAKTTAEEAHVDTDKTLIEQREQLEKTLAEQHVRTLNERFGTAAEKLGSDKAPAVRLAGVYAMAGLADDWEDNRQTCIDVLCAYLRMPYTQDPGAGEEGKLAFLADREVRHTVIRVIANHLRDNATVSWQGRDLDFTGVLFDGGDLSRARFSGGTIRFGGAVFSGGTVDFSGVRFSGDLVDFYSAEFSGGAVDFRGAEFSGGKVDFSRARFSGSSVDFCRARFSGGKVYFNSAEFSGGTVGYSDAEFSAGEVRFGGAKFSGGTRDFSGAEFSGGTVYFDDAQFSGGKVDFSRAGFSGGSVDFSRAGFSGGKVDFSAVSVWLHRPQFDWEANAVPPVGVMMPQGL